MRLFTYAITILTLASCNLINPDEQEPAYVQVANYSLKTVAGQGTSSEKITEMWLYANDNIVSITPKGSQTPLLNTGETKISVRAGIKNNGASNMRIYYPFYEPYDTTLNLQALKYYSIEPRFHYYPEVVIDASRDFETGSNFLEVSGVNQGNFDVVVNPDIAFEGSRCGKAYLTSGNSVLYFKEENPFEIRGGNTVFLEMNYSANQPFLIGISSTMNGSSYPTDLININGTTDTSTPVWNKIYIDLGPIGLTYPNAEQNNIYIKCIRTGDADPVIYLDNLKIVSWP